MRRYDENNFDEHENLHGCNNDEVAMFEAFWAEELEGRKEARKTGGKLFLAVAIALIVTFVGAPLLGAGLGFGSQIATNYVLPRLLNDSAQRESFAFDNVHTPLTSANLQNPLVYRGDYVALVEAVKPSVVTLSVVMQADVSFSAGQTRARAGTGILFYETASRYYVATNAHVIAGGAAVYASIEGSAPIAAVPIGRNDLEDLAVIAIYKS
ncbi:MAG: hypothetical protein FWE44_06695, partial [Defluviitaleaceae bacterium]|nr:hypothetical protein [Defluviitaleaceae bacterium]